MDQYSITVAAASRMLCLRADVKTELGISGTSEDSRIDALIVTASEHVRQLLGRDPWLQTYSEKRPGQGGTNLALRHWPIKGDPSSVTFGTGSSPSTVTASTYSVGGHGRRDRLYRAALWGESEVLAGAPAYGSQKPEYTIAYSAGWVMPSQITAWSVGAVFATNAWGASTDAGEPFIFQATTGGTTHAATEPTWPTVEEGTVTDNDITWTAYDLRLPRPLQEAAIVLASELYTGLQPVGVKSEAFEGRRVEYFSQRPALTASVNALIGPYK